MLIVASSFTEGPPQADGRRYVTERHETADGQVFTFEWLGAHDAAAVLAARADTLSVQLAARAEAEAFVAGTVLPDDPVTFMRRFTMQEEAAIRTLAKTDALVEVFLARLLVVGLVVGSVYRGHPETVGGMQYLVSVGAITAERASEVLNG